MPYKGVGIIELPTAQTSDRPAPRRISAYKWKIIL